MPKGGGSPKKSAGKKAASTSKPSRPRGTPKPIKNTTQRKGELPVGGNSGPSRYFE